MNRKDINKLIVDSLETKLNNYELRDEVFAKIKNNLSNPEKANNYKAVRIPSNRINSLKAAVSFVCGLVIFCSLSLMIWPEARVFASDAIKAIKTIFVIDDNGQVVEKGQDVPIIDNGYSITTNLSDDDIEKKVGFKVIIPDTLSDGFSLMGKKIGLFLGMDISYETNEKISPICQKAILDDSELEKLKEFEPSRFTSGIYSSPAGEFTLLAYKSTDRYFKALEYIKNTDTNYKEIKIGDVTGLWIEEKRPVYPDGDMTQKPLEVISTYDMAWVSNGLLYFISTSVDMSTNRLNLSPEMGKRIAEAFMESQK